MSHNISQKRYIRKFIIYMQYRTKVKGSDYLEERGKNLKRTEIITVIKY